MGSNCTSGAMNWTPPGAGPPGKPWKRALTEQSSRQRRQHPCEMTTLSDSCLSTAETISTQYSPDTAVKPGRYSGFTDHGYDENLLITGRDQMHRSKNSKFQDWGSLSVCPSTSEPTSDTDAIPGRNPGKMDLYTRNTALANLSTLCAK